MLSRPSVICLSLVLWMVAVRAGPSPMLEQWTTQFGGTGDDDIRAMTTDPTGNIYVAGTATHDTNTYFPTETLLLKTDPTGSVLWSLRYADGFESGPTSIATDVSQNVIVGGWIRHTPTNYGGYVLKCDALGRPLWTNLVERRVRLLTADSDGGVAFGTFGGVQLHRLSTAGIELWKWRYRVGDSPSDSVTGLAVDDKGGVILSGSVREAEGVGFLAKLNPMGSEEWRLDLGFAPAGLTLGQFGDIFCAGSGSRYQRSTFVIRRYTPAGELVWSREYRGPSGIDRVAAVAVDQLGNSTVAGTSAGYQGEEGYGDDYVTVKYDGNGRHLWTARYTLRRGERANHVALDISGNTYVSGDLAIVKYSPEGIQLWSAFQAGPEVRLVTVGDSLIVGDNSIHKLVPDTSAILPRITRLPTTQRVSLASDAVFTVSADGDAPLTYKWRFSSRPFSQSDLFSAFTSTLVISNVSPRDVGEYWVEISNRIGTIASPVVRLEIVPQLTVSTGYLGALLWAHGNFSHEYQLQSSADLRNWSLQTNFVPVNGSMPIYLRSLGLTNGHSIFFRTLELPRVE